MNKQKLFQFLYVLLIVGVLLFVCWMVFWLKGEGSSCMNNPISYVEEKIGGDVECLCTGGGSIIRIVDGKISKDTNPFISPE